MSQVTSCPTCGGKSKFKETINKITYQAIEDDELIKKVVQLKKAMHKYKEKAEKLEKELAEIKAKS